MARDDVSLTVWGRSGPISDGTLDYLPFGVRVLKLRVQRNQARPADAGAGVAAAAGLPAAQSPQCQPR